MSTKNSQETVQGQPLSAQPDIVIFPSHSEHQEATAISPEEQKMCVT